jgi:predicted nucleotidyltransferase
MSLASMVVGLAEAGVRFVIIGGFAGNAHGSTIVTEDLDICHDTEPGNLKILADLLASWDAYPRGMEPGLPFYMDVRTLRNMSVLTLRTRQGDIDLLANVEGVGDYEQCAATAEWIDFASVRFQILGLDALIASKKAAGREKDLQHLRVLEAVRELRRKESTPPTSDSSSSDPD